MDHVGLLLAYLHRLEPVARYLLEGHSWGHVYLRLDGYEEYYEESGDHYPRPPEDQYPVPVVRHLTQPLDIMLSGIPRSARPSSPSAPGAPSATRFPQVVRWVSGHPRRWLPPGP